VRLALALICLSLAGCAMTMTVAAGKDARASILQPQCKPTNLALNSGEPKESETPSALLKTTTRTEYDDKIGFKPQVVSTLETTEPASPPPPPPLHESQGAAMSEAGGGALRTLARWFVCGITLGSVCL
jgi:hypothetical protein